MITIIMMVDYLFIQWRVCVNLVWVCVFPVFVGYGQLTKRPRITIDDSSHTPTEQSPPSPTALEDDNEPVTTVCLSLKKKSLL
jgi:hypothetical protein